MYACHLTTLTCFSYAIHCPPLSLPPEPLPSSIDSWARGIVPQQSTSSLQSKISTAPPVHILPFITSVSVTTTEQQGEDGRDPQQEKQRRKSILSETTASSVGKVETLSIYLEL